MDRMSHISFFKRFACPRSANRPTRHVISAILRSNLTHFATQSGWGCHAIWLGSDCNKAEGVLPRPFPRRIAPATNKKAPRALLSSRHTLKK